MTTSSESTGDAPDRASEDRGGRSTPDFPVVLTLTGRPCLVVGGGPVAARRAQGLAEVGALVTVVAIGAIPSIRALAEAGTVALDQRPYRGGEAARFDFVVTATGDPSVDGAVVADAAAAGVLVNSAEGQRPGTVQLPAVLRRGPVTVAVATGGTSPALARWLRDRIADSLPPGLATVAALVEEARTEMRASGQATDSVDWAGLLDLVVLPLVDADRIDDARAALHDAWQPSARESGEDFDGGPR